MERVTVERRGHRRCGRGRDGVRGRLATDLGRVPTRSNGARRPAPLPARRWDRLARAAFRLAGVALIAGAAAGCSLSMPISGPKPDPDATGTIDRTVALLSPALDAEDLRRARAAMAVALDPQGNGARAGWQNAQTGAHGGFAAAAPPFAEHDRVCRRFTGDVAPAGAAARRLSGSACRDGDGTWRVTAGTGA